jgi:transposase
MPWCKYTREVLAEAVSASVSMAGVLRHLDIPQNGGAHAHLRRRIADLGLDTSHFLGRGHLRGRPHQARRRPGDILVLRSADRHRAAPQALRRALVTIGRHYRCEACATGGSWNGRELVLHVDHINGQFWDCRPENLRFLCPNCHSQTATYAGRNRRPTKINVVRVDETGSPIPTAVVPRATTEDERAALIQRVEAGEIGCTDAARIIGCHRNHVYRLRRRLAERGSLSTTRPRTRRSDAHRDEVVAIALANPHLGPKKIAAALRDREIAPVQISHGTVTNILRASGLSRMIERERLASERRDPSTAGLQSLQSSKVTESGGSGGMADAPALGAGT